MSAYDLFLLIFFLDKKFEILFNSVERATEEVVFNVPPPALQPGRDNDYRSFQPELKEHVLCVPLFTLSTLIP